MYRSPEFFMTSAMFLKWTKFFLVWKAAYKNFSLHSWLFTKLCATENRLLIECPSILIACTATSSAFGNMYLHTDHLNHQCQSHNCRMKHGNYLQHRTLLLKHLRQEIKSILFRWKCSLELDKVKCNDSIQKLVRKHCCHLIFSKK